MQQYALTCAYRIPILEPGLLSEQHQLFAYRGSDDEPSTDALAGSVEGSLLPDTPERIPLLIVMIVN
jgi:hypothetical protein